MTHFIVQLSKYLMIGLILLYVLSSFWYLMQKKDSATDDFLRERLEHLINIIERQSLVDKLNAWHEKREYDLLEPYFVLSKYM